MAELLTSDKKRTLVHTLVDELKPRMASMLPRHVKVERVAAVCLTAIIRTPDLLEAVAAGGVTKASLASALLDCARLGIMPDGVEAALVTFKDHGVPKVQLLMMYRGRLTLARRSKEIRTVEARVIHAKDRYHFTYGLKPRLEHEPADSDDPGPLVAVYAIGTLTNGGQQFEFLWKREVDAIRARSRAGQAGPWVTDYEEMAKKTALHRLCKLLPYATEVAGLIDRVEAEEPAGEIIDITPMADAALAAGAPAPPAKDKLAQFTSEVNRQQAESAKTSEPEATKPEAESPERVAQRTGSQYQPATDADLRAMTRETVSTDPRTVTVPEPATPVPAAAPTKPTKPNGRSRAGGMDRLATDALSSSDAKLGTIRQDLATIDTVVALEALEAKLYDPGLKIWAGLVPAHKTALNRELAAKRETLEPAAVA